MFDEGFKNSKYKCKTFESSSPPDFKGSSVSFNDVKTGARIELEKSRVNGFRKVDKQGTEIFRIKVCGK